MKLNKKIIGLSIAGLAVVTTVPALAITLSSCSSSKVKYFYDSFNSPYKELEMFAKSLDKAQLQFKQTNQGNTKTEDQSFESIAKTVNDSMKDFVQKLSQTPGIKALTENKNTTVLFVKNDTLTWNDDEGVDLTNMNRFQMEQPILYSQIYSEPNFEECPGFGFKFPAPINSKSNSLFDNWFEIGASQLDSQGPTSNVPERLAESWNGTADFVFYLYDSQKIGINNQQNLINFVNKYPQDSNSPFLPARLLKPNGETKYVIPLDIQWMYNGLWDQVGSFTIDYLFAKIFNNINSETKKVNQFLPLNFKNAKMSETKDAVDTVTESVTWNPYNIVKKETQLKFVRPSDDANYIKGCENAKYFATTMFNTTGSALSLGIQPDYISKNENQGVYENLSGYLMPYNAVLEENNKNDKQKQVSQDLFFSQNTGTFSTWLKDNEVYALADNRETFGSPDKTPSLEDETKGIVNLTHEKSPTDTSVLQFVKPVYTERNDSSATQQPMNGLPIVFDKNKNQAMSVQSWKDSQ